MVGKIPDATTMVFSSGTDAMVSASFQFCCYDHVFQHIIAVEEIRGYKPAPEVNGMLAGKSGKGKKDGGKIWLVSENLNLVDFGESRAVDMQAVWVDR